MPSGGARPNAGRKPLHLGRKQMNICVTDTERSAIKAVIDRIRGGNHMPLYYLGEERTNPVYESPVNSVCPFCNDYISVGSAHHNGNALDVCIGCNALFDYKEEPTK